MNIVELSDNELTFLHHIIGYKSLSDLINFTQIKVKNAREELDKINIDNEFIDKLFNTLKNSYDNMLSEKYIDEWKNAVKNDETTLSLDEYHLTMSNKSV